MTLEEARKELIKFVHLKTSQEPVFLKICSEALEKQIPKKPKYEKTHYWDVVENEPVCPECDHFLDKFHFIGTGKKITYCDHCGQAIDWGKEIK